MLRIHTFESLHDGARLIVLGGVHGDETCGTEAIVRVARAMDTGELDLLRGKLSMVPVANPLARRMGRREGERNLNRSFQPSTAPADYEACITNKLCPLLAAHDVLLDLHSFQSGGDAFAMIGPRNNAGTLEPFQRADEEGWLAMQLGTTRVVEGWLDIYAAAIAQRGQAATPEALAFSMGTNEYMRSVGGYAITLECGQHRDPAAPGVAYDAILAALRHLGMLAPADSPPKAPALLRLISVVNRASVDDAFVRDWASFDPVKQGQPIAWHKGGVALRAPCDGYVVFPNAQAAPGTEWFYLAVNSDRDLAALSRPLR